MVLYLWAQVGSGRCEGFWCFPLPTPGDEGWGGAMLHKLTQHLHVMGSCSGGQGLGLSQGWGLARWGRSEGAEDSHDGHSGLE